MPRWGAKGTKAVSACCVFDFALMQKMRRLRGSVMAQRLLASPCLSQISLRSVCESLMVRMGGNGAGAVSLAFFAVRCAKSFISINYSNKRNPFAPYR